MRTVDADSFATLLADWQLKLRNANECGGCEAALLERVINALNEQPTVNEDSSTGWIPADTYVPYHIQFAGNDISRPVWVCIEHKGKRFVAESRMYNGKWRLPLFCKDEARVTHWMPMNKPEPPTEVESDV